MSVEQTTPAAAPSGPISIDQFAAEMTAEQEAANAPVEAEEDEQDTPAEVIADAEEDEAPEIEESRDEEDEPEAQPEPIPDPPQSWSKEDREAWAELTPKARDVVLRREKDRDAAVSRAVQQASEVTKAVQSLSDEATRIAHLGQTEFERKWGKGDEGNIDWVRLAHLSRQDPDNYDYTSVRAEFERERTDLREAQRQAAHRSELARRTYLAEQVQELERIAPELVDAKEGKARRDKVTAYLIEQGFAPEVLPDISAIELKIAWKAARFDEMEAKAKQAATAPRRNPVAAPTKPVRPAGNGDASPQRNLQALSQKLTHSGKLDDFVNLMNAEDEQRARKQANRK